MTEDPSKPPLGHPATLIATGFGIGYLPRAPGTWGSLAALPFAWLIAGRWGTEGMSAAILIAFGIGWWAAHRYSTMTATTDAPEIVIDEVAGQWLTLLLTPPDLMLYALGFILFRVADILKPWPANLAERALGGGLGAMMDDMLAAFYALAGMAFAQYLLEMRGV